jgi:hypothetical protein
MAVVLSDSDFKPYVEERTYKVVLSMDEALLIQKLREMSYGAITVHLVNKKIVRTETVNSELTKDRKKEAVTIAVEML